MDSTQHDLFAARGIARVRLLLHLLPPSHDDCVRDHMHKTLKESDPEIERI